MSDSRSTPLVSVIVPTYNRHEALLRAARSVLGQTYRAIELWIVDDGSEPPVDLPGDVASDPRTNLVRLDTNTRGTAVRNVAIERSSGPLVAFLDDDDEWFPNKLERQVPVLLDADPTVGCVECGYEIYDGDRLDFRYVPRPKPDLRRLLLERPMLQPSTIVLRRSVLDEIGGFDPQLPRAHDWDLFVRFADRYAVVSMPDVLVRRAHSATPPDTIAEWNKVMHERLRPRIEMLAPLARRRVLAWHRFDEGMDMLRAGHCREALASIFGAWLSDPRSLRYLLHGSSALLGAKGWELGTRLGRASRRLFSRLRGKDPRVRSW
jgi:glycosyltransferase involved in cell wall biosynthesis